MSQADSLRHIADLWDVRDEQIDNALTRVAVLETVLRDIVEFDSFKLDGTGDVTEWHKSWNAKMKAGRDALKREP